MNGLTDMATITHRDRGGGTSAPPSDSISSETQTLAQDLQNGEKTPQTTDKPLVGSISQSHGGALNAGGTPGNRGGGSPGSIGPVLASSGLAPMQLRAAIHLASGLNERETAAQCGAPLAHVKRWTKLPSFQQALEMATARRLARMEDLLLAGEREAVETLTAALTAMTTAKSGKKVIYVPDWPTRRAAADSLLNRRGERGKPVDRIQQATMNFNSPEVRNELTQAMADRGVRVFLEKDPALAAQFRRELAQLASGSGGEPTTSPQDGTAGSVEQFDVAD